MFNVTKDGAVCELFKSKIIVDEKDNTNIFFFGKLIKNKNNFYLI